MSERINRFDSKTRCNRYILNSQWTVSIYSAIVAMAYHLQYTEDDICHYLLPIVYINLTKKKPYSHDSTWDTWDAQTHTFDPVSTRDVLSGAFFYLTTHKNRLNSFDMPFRG